MSPRRKDLPPIGEAARSGDAKALAGAISALGLEPGIAALAAAPLARMGREGRLPAPEEGPIPPLRESDAALIAAMSLPPGEAALLGAMARLARARPHPTGRIRYSDAELMALSGLRSRRDYLAAWNGLASKGLAKAWCVGSRDPFTAVSLPWLGEGEKTD